MNSIISLFRFEKIREILENAFHALDIYNEFSIMLLRPITYTRKKFTIEYLYNESYYPLSVYNIFREGKPFWNIKVYNDAFFNAKLERPPPKAVQRCRYGTCMTLLDREQIKDFGEQLDLFIKLFQFSERVATVEVSVEVELLKIDFILEDDSKQLTISIVPGYSTFSESDCIKGLKYNEISL